MRDEIGKLLVFSGALAVVMAAVMLPDAHAQAPGAQATKKGAPARSASGRPDLQGLWNFATVTPLERPKEFADRGVLTAEEAARLEERAVRDRFVDIPPKPVDDDAKERRAGVRVRVPRGELRHTWNPRRGASRGKNRVQRIAEGQVQIVW